MPPSKPSQLQFKYAYWQFSQCLMTEKKDIALCVENDVLITFVKTRMR